MGAIVLLVGVIGLLAVIAVVTALVITHSRRNTRNGYQTQQFMPPSVQQPYHPQAPTQTYGYPTAPTPPPQTPNPYTQEPPYQG